MAAKSSLPADPQKFNGIRSSWAGAALALHDSRVGNAAPLQQLAALLCNLHHWADRHGVDFDQALLSGGKSYDQETVAVAEPVKPKKGKK